VNDFGIGIEVENVTISNLSHPAVMSFSHKSPVPENMTTKCVFLNRYDKWDDFGCLSEKLQNSTTCRCSHFTFFAVLMQIPASSLDTQNTRTLTYLTYIGCAVSAAFCALTLLTHWKHCRRAASEHSVQIHVNLASALLLLNLSFLASAVLSPLSGPGLCTAMAVLLHYSLLCTFTWMALEALHLCRLLWQPFTTYIRRYLLWLCLLGWGFPASVVLIIVAVNKKNYGQTTTGTSSICEGNPLQPTSRCWVTNVTIHYASITGYLGIVLFLNAGILVSVITKMAQLRSVSSHNETSRTCKATCSVLGLSCALGLTWGLGFLSIGYINLPILYIFTILNSLQGFFLFLWICMIRYRKEELAWKSTQNLETKPQNNIITTTTT
uniref:Uncharacterized protein n=1 Tax=Lepisosteus oculatus TaxID=7918 RepID=W5MIL3_LEPOC